MKISQHFTFRKQNIKTLLITAFIVVSMMVWMSMRIYDYYYVSTDNAYVNANVVEIAPRVTGQVTQLFITNNQFVHQGQPLFAIDPIPFQNALTKAQAQYTISKATLMNARATATRTHTLANNKYVSNQDNDNVNTALETAEASLALAKASLDQANLDLSWTHITAPTSGWVTNVSLLVGDVVAANQPIFALIGDSEFWVDANFKETELANIDASQRAVIHVDMYPDHPFNGVVQSISGGTGSAFSLLPPQNATGNWVKVAQRIPVRIRVLNPDPRYPLRIGSSAAVRISLRNKIEMVYRSKPNA
jgi:membrane fusion protein (multidrug efflux system)